jgi:hypothetical protein
MSIHIKKIFIASMMLSLFLAILSLFTSIEFIYFFIAGLIGVATAFFIEYSKNG